MRTEDVMQDNPWFDPRPVLEETRNLARSVATGARQETSVGAIPAAILAAASPEAFRDRSEVSASSATCAGLTLLIMWMMQQAGPGAVEWPAKMQAWLDAWEKDFRSTHGGDARAGYADLVALLDKLEALWTIAYPIAVSSSRN